MPKHCKTCTCSESLKLDGQPRFMEDRLGCKWLDHPRNCGCTSCSRTCQTCQGSGEDKDKPKINDGGHGFYPDCGTCRGTRTYTPTPFVGKPYNAATIAEHNDAVRTLPWLSSLELPPPGDEAATTPGFRILCVMPRVEADHKVLDHFDDLKQAAQDRAEEEAAAADEQPATIAEIEAAARRRDLAADFKLQERLLKLAEMPGFVVDIVAENQCAVLDVYEMAGADRFVDPVAYDIVFVDADDREAMALAHCDAKRIVLVGDTKNQPHAVPATLTALYRVIADELMLRHQQLRFDWAAPELPLPVPSLDDVAVDEAIVRLS